MKPVLIVEGNRYEAQACSYSYHDENGFYRLVNLDEIEKVEFEGRYEPIVQLISKRIEAHEEIIAEYETELMHEYKANLKAPFASDKMRDLAQKHEVLCHIVDGLHETLGIVLQDVYMQDDVDLSGGEEING